MADFGHLRALEVKADKTAEYTLFQVQGAPVLVLAPATESNIPLFNAALKRSGQTTKRVKAGVANLNTIKEGRSQDCELYARYVVKGWRGVVDVNGSEVKFTKDDCHDFLVALPSYIFDDVREFARDPINFVDDDDDDGMPDTEAVSKN